MSLEVSQQQWSLLYYRKKSRFNQYAQFRSKSFQYQKILGKLHFLSCEDDESNKKEIKGHVKALKAAEEEIKTILGEIHEEMKFLKLNNFASLIQSFEELISSLHNYTVQQKKNRLQQNGDSPKNESLLNQNCQRCLASINILNIKKIYDQITTTQACTQQQQKLKMTRQQRSKMIGQLDEYDILIAQKDNYLRKVNAVLENKGKVCQLSNTDKTYNFLLEYLSTIEKLQEKRAKSYKPSPDAELQEERRKEEQSYKHIVEYIKQVIVEHFVNECSGPVKKMFENVNIDYIFKSYKDHNKNSQQDQEQPSTKNHQTQTITTNEVEQLKLIEKRMDFKLKEISVIRTNKDQLEKKFISALELNRKVQSEVYDLKREKRTLQNELRNLTESVTLLREKYKEKVEEFEQEHRRTFQTHINQRQKIMRVSKQIEADFKLLETEHKKCSSGKKFAIVQPGANAETQTENMQIEDSNIDLQSRGESFGAKRRKSLFKNIMISSFKSERRSHSKEMAGGINQLVLNSIVDEKSDSDRSNAGKRLELQSEVVKVHVSLSDEERSRMLKAQKDKEPKNKSTKTYRLNKSSKPKQLKTQQSLNTMDSKDLKDTPPPIPPIDKEKRLKISMTSFRKPPKQEPTQNLADSEPPHYNFSKFNQFTSNQNENSQVIGDLVEEENESDESGKGESRSNERKIFQVSERLYKKKEMENNEAQFERVVEKGKEKFYINKISRDTGNYKAEKEKIKEISQILKPYVFNNSSNMISMKRQQSRTNIKSIRQRLSQISHSQKRFSVDHQSTSGKQDAQNTINCQYKMSNCDSLSPQQRLQTSKSQKKTVGKDIITVQHIIQSQFSYLKAVGFIDFIMKIDHDSKKMLKGMKKIENQVNHGFKTPTEEDLKLFGGYEEAENYIRGRHFWTIDNLKDNIMVYTKNDALSTKVHKYFNLLKRANPELYGTIIGFLSNPISAVFGKEPKVANEAAIVGDDSYFVKDLFNQLQKYHKIKHTECTHISDFLEKIGFYKYSYF